MNITAVVSEARRIVRLGSLALDLDHSVLSVDGQRISTTPGQFQTLLHLATHRTVPMTRETIVRAAFGADTDRDERIGDVLIARLRHLLAVAGAPVAIRVVPGRGYLLEQEDGDDSAPDDHSDRDIHATSPAATICN